MKYKLVNKYEVENLGKKQTIYEVLAPGSKIPKLLKENIGRKCLVGTDYVDQNNTDIYYYSKETAHSIDLEPVKTVVKDGRVKMIVQNTNTEEWVHRVIGFSWLEGFNNGKFEIHHKDRDRTNNHINNLQLVRPLYNSYVEFRAGNPFGRTFMCNAIQDAATMFDYKDFLDASTDILKEEGYTVIRETDRNLNKETMRALVYIVEKNINNETLEDLARILDRNGYWKNKKDKE